MKKTIESIREDYANSVKELTVFLMSTLEKEDSEKATALLDVSIGCYNYLEELAQDANKISEALGL